MSRLQTTSNTLLDQIRTGEANADMIDSGLGNEDAEASVVSGESRMPGDLVELQLVLFSVPFRNFYLSSTGPTAHARLFLLSTLVFSVAAITSTPAMVDGLPA